MLVTLGTEGLTKSLTMTNKKRPARASKNVRAACPKAKLKFKIFFFSSLGKVNLCCSMH